MTRYFLRNPTNSHDYVRLPFGQQTVFKSVIGEQYFLLALVPSGRALMPYDPHTQTTFGAASPVPNDWDGEPVTYSIEADTWDSLLALRVSGDIVASGVLADLVARISDGDFLAIRRPGEQTRYRLLRYGTIIETVVSPYP